MDILKRKNLDVPTIMKRVQAFRPLRRQGFSAAWVAKNIIDMSDFQTMLQVMIRYKSGLPPLDRRLSEEEKVYIRFRTLFRRLDVEEVLGLIDFGLPVDQAASLKIDIQQVADYQEREAGELVQVLSGKVHDQWTSTEYGKVGVLQFSWRRAVRRQMRDLLFVAHEPMADFYTNENYHAVAQEFISYASQRHSIYYNLLKDDLHLSSFRIYVLTLLKFNLVRAKAFYETLPLKEQRLRNQIRMYRFQYQKKHGHLPSDRQILESLSEKFDPAVINHILTGHILSVPFEERTHKNRKNKDGPTSSPVALFIAIGTVIVAGYIMWRRYKEANNPALQETLSKIRGIRERIVRQLLHSQQPVVILIGGASSVGKSTLARLMTFGRYGLNRKQIRLVQLDIQVMKALNAFHVIYPYVRLFIVEGILAPIYDTPKSDNIRIFLTADELTRVTNIYKRVWGNVFPLFLFNPDIFYRMADPWAEEFESNNVFGIDFSQPSRPRPALIKSALRKNNLSSSPAWSSKSDTSLVSTRLNSRKQGIKNSSSPISGGAASLPIGRASPNLRGPVSSALLPTTNAEASSPIGLFNPKSWTLTSGQEIELDVKDYTGEVIERRRYIVEGRIGEGGFSEVWKVRDLQTDEWKVIKTFSTSGLRRIVRNFQNVVAYQDRFGAQYYEEVVRLILYNYKFVSIVIRSLGDEMPEIINREGYAWVKEANSWSIIMPYRDLRSPYLNLDSSAEVAEKLEQFSIMRKLSEQLNSAGAGNLVPQIAINAVESSRAPPKMAWFSLPNMLRDADTGRLVWVDLERNIVALPFGYTFPIFFFKQFRQIIAHSKRRNLRPDPMHMMDMVAFKRFISDHRDLLTEEKTLAIDLWIAEYEQLSREFISRSPWFMERHLRKGLGIIDLLLVKLRVNNVYVWRLIGEITDQKAEKMLTSRINYYFYWFVRTIKRLPGFVGRVLSSLMRNVISVFTSMTNLARWILNKISEAFSIMFFEESALKILKEYYHAAINKAYHYGFISRSKGSDLHQLEKDYLKHPEYIKLFRAYMYPKLFVWAMRFVGFVFTFIDIEVELTKSIWESFIIESGGFTWMDTGFILLALSFVLPIFYRLIVTFAFAKRYPQVNFDTAMRWNLMPFVGIVIAVLIQIYKESRSIKPWVILQIRLYAFKLIKHVPGFGESNGLLHYYADQYIANPIIRILFEKTNRDGPSLKGRVAVPKEPQKGSRKPVKSIQSHPRGVKGKSSSPVETNVMVEDHKGMKTHPKIRINSKHSQFNDIRTSGGKFTQIEVQPSPYFSNTAAILENSSFNSSIDTRRFSIALRISRRMVMTPFAVNMSSPLSSFSRQSLIEVSNGLRVFVIEISRGLLTRLGFSEILKSRIETISYTFNDDHKTSSFDKRVSWLSSFFLISVVFVKMRRTIPFRSVADTANPSNFNSNRVTLSSVFPIVWRFRPISFFRSDWPSATIRISPRRLSNSAPAWAWVNALGSSDRFLFILISPYGAVMGWEIVSGNIGIIGLFRRNVKDENNSSLLISYIDHSISTIERSTSYGVLNTNNASSPISENKDLELGIEENHPTGLTDIEMKNRLKSLTRREHEVLLLVLKGLSNKEIAEDLGISDGTANIHITNIFKKLEVRKRLALINEYGPLFSSVSGDADEFPRLPSSITPREREVIELAVQVGTALEIANKLGISIFTVKSHLYNVFEKLEVYSRSKLAARYGQAVLSDLSLSIDEKQSGKGDEEKSASSPADDRPNTDSEESEEIRLKIRKADQVAKDPFDKALNQLQAAAIKTREQLRSMTSNQPDQIKQIIVRLDENVKKHLEGHPETSRIQHVRGRIRNAFEIIEVREVKLEHLHQLSEVMDDILDILTAQPLSNILGLRINERSRISQQNVAKAILDEMLWLDDHIFRFGLRNRYQQLPKEVDEVVDLVFEAMNLAESLYRTEGNFEAEADQPTIEKLNNLRVKINRKMEEMQHTLPDDPMTVDHTSSPLGSGKKYRENLGTSSVPTQWRNNPEQGSEQGEELRRRTSSPKGSSPVTSQLNVKELQRVVPSEVKNRHNLVRFISDQFGGQWGQAISMIGTPIADRQIWPYIRRKQRAGLSISEIADDVFREERRYVTGEQSFYQGGRDEHRTPRMRIVIPKEQLDSPLAGKVKFFVRRGYYDPHFDVRLFNRKLIDQLIEERHIKSPDLNADGSLTLSTIVFDWGLRWAFVTNFEVYLYTNSSMSDDLLKKIGSIEKLTLQAFSLFVAQASFSRVKAAPGSWLLYVSGRYQHHSRIERINAMYPELGYKLIYKPLGEPNQWWWELDLTTDENPEIYLSSRTDLTTGLFVREYAIEGPHVRVGAEVFSVDLKVHHPVQRYANELRTRDLVEDNPVNRDPRVGYSIGEYVAQENQQSGLVLGQKPNSVDVVLGVNSTQTHFWMSNTLLVINSRLVKRKRGRRALFQTRKIEPIHGPFSILSLDRGRPGIFDVIFERGKPVGPMPVRNGFAGPLLLRDGVDMREHIRFNQRPEISGNDLWWPHDMRHGYTAFGYDRNGRLVVLQLTGDPMDPIKREMNLAGTVHVLRSLGIDNAILGGSSGDVQRFSKYSNPQKKYGKSRAGSLIATKGARPDGGRALGTALLFYLQFTTDDEAFVRNHKDKGMASSPVLYRKVRSINTGNEPTSSPIVPIVLAIWNWEVHAVPERLAVPMKRRFEVAIAFVEENIVRVIVTYLVWQNEELSGSLTDRLKALLRKLKDAIKRVLGIDDEVVVKVVLPPVVRISESPQYKTDLSILDPRFQMLDRQASSSIQHPASRIQHQPIKQVGAVVAASASPINSGVFTNQIWLQYFNDGLALSNPLKREAMKKRISKVINLDSDLSMIGEYPLLNNFVNELRGERLVNQAVVGVGLASAKPFIKGLRYGGAGPTAASNFNSEELRLNGAIKTNQSTIMPLRPDQPTARPQSEVGMGARSRHAPSGARWMAGLGEKVTNGSPTAAENSVEKVGPKMTAVGVGPTAVPNPNNEPSRLNEASKADQSNTVPSWPIHPTVAGKGETATFRSSTAANIYKKQAHAVVTKSTNRQTSIRNQGQVAVPENQRFSGMAGLGEKVPSGVSATALLFKGHKPLRELQPTARPQSEVGMGARMAEFGGETPIQGSPATAIYMPPFEYELTFYPVREMQMAASPVPIEKGPLLLGEMPRIEPRSTLFMDTIKSTKTAYLRKILTNLWGLIGNQILGFFGGLSKVFKIVFRLNRTPEEVTSVELLSESIVDTTSDLIMSTDLPNAAVVASSSVPMSGKNVFMDGIWLNYFEMGLASNIPKRIKRVKDRVTEAIMSGSDLSKVTGDPGKYALLNALIVDITEQKIMRVQAIQDNMPLRELQPIVRPQSEVGMGARSRPTWPKATSRRMAGLEGGKNNQNPDQFNIRYKLFKLLS